MKRLSLKHPQYYADQFEDARLRDLWPACPDVGFFVDVGAGDGVNGSNTLHFELNGWKGVLIDGDSRRFPALAASRPWSICRQAVINSTESDLTFYQHENADMSGLNGEGLPVVVKTVRLTTLLQSLGIHSQIDLLSIDTEGTELDVFASLNFEKFKPKAIVIEHIHAGMRIGEFLKNFTYKGYVAIDVNAMNAVLIHGDHYR